MGSSLNTAVLGVVFVFMGQNFKQLKNNFCVFKKHLLRIQELVVAVMSQFHWLIVIQTKTVLLQLGSQDGKFGKCILFL